MSKRYSITTVVKKILSKVESLLLKWSKTHCTYLFDHMIYKSRTGHKLHLCHPQTLADKLYWLNRYDDNPLKIICADKYRVHTYLQEKGLDEYTVPLLGKWNRVEDIDFSMLPNQFVLKCNHGCGCNIFVTDKTKMNIDLVKNRLSEWLQIDYGKLFNESHYSKIEPCVIAEEYIHCLADEKSLVDYKVQCIGGKARFVLVCRDREGHSLKLSSYSIDWQREDYVYNEDPITLPKPQHLKEMIQIANKIANDFPYVRVDFYDVNGNLYLGELTFTPDANALSYYKYEYLKEWGKLIDENVTKR